MFWGSVGHRAGVSGSRVDGLGFGVEGLSIEGLGFGKLRISTGRRASAGGLLLGFGIFVFFGQLSDAF